MGMTKMNVTGTRRLWRGSHSQDALDCVWVGCYKIKVAEVDMHMPTRAFQPRMRISLSYVGGGEDEATAFCRLGCVG
jgi:hypothetical protein